MLDTLIENLAEELELEGSLATETPGIFALPLEEDLRSISRPLGKWGSPSSAASPPARTPKMRSFLRKPSSRISLVKAPAAPSSAR